MSNRTRSIVVYAGALVLAFTLLFPPWVYTFQAQGISQVRVTAGYALLFKPPAARQNNYLHGVELDVGRLLLEVAAVAIAVGVGWWSSVPRPGGM